MDAEIVRSNIYEKLYIPGPMFGTYSFLNISCGREDNSDLHSLKNMLEIAVLLKIIQLLYRGILRELFISICSCLNVIKLSRTKFNPTGGLYFFCL